MSDFYIVKTQSMTHITSTYGYMKKARRKQKASTDYTCSILHFITAVFHEARDKHRANKGLPNDGGYEGRNDYP